MPNVFLQGFRASTAFLRKYRVVVILLAGLFVAAGSGRFLAGNLWNTNISGLQVVKGGFSMTEDDLRACSGQHTMFENMETITEVHEAYTTEMESIFLEREELMRKPTTWTCGADADRMMVMPNLQALVDKLPGWHVVPEPPSGARRQRPVTVDAFSAIAGELQREYECKLIELSHRALALIANNKDISPGDFCCTDFGCASVTTGATCTSAVTSDPQCNRECAVFLTTSEIATRLPTGQEIIDIERKQSRTALERALQTMRGFDTTFPEARELVCYQRASLDLRNELNLLSDAVSCMPKIWDAVTSLHDRTINK
jgi:hypothetical protein